MDNAMPQPGPALLVFADDWGRHPSSCQHLVRHLLPYHTVYWVNTIGTRKPGLDWATLSRGWEKVRQWLRPARPSTNGSARPCVLNPRMWPMFSSRFDRWLNRTLLRRQLASVLHAEANRVVAVTTIPLVADLIGQLPVDRWVYYCVDEFSQWPGLDQRTLHEMEEKLVAKADVLIAVSDTLRARLEGRGRQAHLLTHGVEPEFWRVDGQARRVPELENLPRPLITFWGVIDRRMDVQFVRQLADDLSEGTIVLLGPEQHSDPDLLKIPRVVHVPPLAFEQLPQVAQATSVLVMPYADLPVTRAIQPLKLKEYLATGKPAVVRDLPATRPWADCLDLANSPEGFSRMVRERLATGVPEQQLQARGRLSEETWDRKAEQFSRWALEG
jgi:glycosyltransferase involved in cell wall biosynthesis